ncbi:hypothetical protein H1C71_038024, partial [Ictidomys tridecemlineatus]
MFIVLLVAYTTSSMALIPGAGFLGYIAEFWNHKTLALLASVFQYSLLWLYGKLSSSYCGEYLGKAGTTKIKPNHFISSAMSCESLPSQNCLSGAMHEYFLLALANTGS